MRQICFVASVYFQILSEKCKSGSESEFWRSISRSEPGIHPGRTRSFLSLVLVLFQNLLSGFKVLFARQGSLLGFALSDASDPIRCNFNRDNPHNLHGAVQQNLHGKRKLRFGRKQPVVRCQRDECIDD